MSDTPTKLPGLSSLKESELRDLYVKEVGAEVPPELSTVASLKEAITAHRSTSVDTAPATALDALTAGSTAAAGNPNDSELKRDTGPSANAAGPVVAPAAEDVVAPGHIRITSKANGLQQDMPLATWKALGVAQQGFTQAPTPKPKDLQ